MDSAAVLAGELHASPVFVRNVIRLIDEGNTIPFIARYRKEMHGSMDDTTLRKLSERLTYLRGLQARREEILRALTAQNALTPELSIAVERAETLVALEDIYRPYRPRRRTRASVAREKGLEPLARLIFAQQKNCPTPLEAAQAYVNGQNGITAPDEALQGANDIIAEWISDDADIRGRLRKRLLQRGVLTSRAATEEDTVYRLYYSFSQPIARIQDHQILAIDRGEREGKLRASITQEPVLLQMICDSVEKPGSASAEFVRTAAADAMNRLIFPSLEREIRTLLTQRACEGAIGQFALNLKPLLMQPPIKGHVTMGLDPGYRNGCKVAVVDATGKVLDTAVVYPTLSELQRQQAMDRLEKLIRRHHVEHIAIGNGTASRETEQMTVELIQRIPQVRYMIVSEAGASAYSASELAAQELPQYDVNLRSAVSIARRLQDPLAELVKIEPKAIGVGQYQHDMPQKRLEEALNGVVEDCVNAVGADINTASAALLRRVAGLSAVTAKNIVAYREENGPFTSRRQLLKVPKLGPKAYEQCAGFLRVPEGRSVLDNTGVHPESYASAEALLQQCGYSLTDVKNGRLQQLPQRVRQLGPERLAEHLEIGLPTLNDIVSELIKPGRDPRDALPAPILRRDVLKTEDLRPGMIVTGTVRNVIDFGVFVDIGVHMDGLVHISEMADRYVKHPSELLNVGDVIKAVVLQVDKTRGRISLSIKQVPKDNGVDIPGSDATSSER